MLQTPEIQGLRVVRLRQDSLQPDYVELAPGDPRFSAVGIVVHVALAILESEGGRDQLVHTARGIIEGRIASRADQTLIYNDRMDRLPRWIDFFLSQLRDNLPDIRLVYTLPGEAATRRFPWGNNMRQYNPKAAGFIELNKLVSSTSCCERHCALPKS